MLQRSVLLLARRLRVAPGSMLHIGLKSAMPTPLCSGSDDANIQAWRRAASKITWSTPFSKVMDDSRSPFIRWFDGGKLNTCFNCLDRHILAGHGEQNALVFESPMSDTHEVWSYQRLFDEVSSLSQVLRARGVTKGDRVLIYMPNTPQAAAAMLACARLGAVHCVVFGGFAPRELAVRIRDSRPKVVIYSSCGLDGAKVIPYQPLVEEALALAASDNGPVVSACVVYQRPQSLADLSNGDRDCDWATEVGAPRHRPTNPGEGVEQVESSHPLYILYTSGTTGTPKGVVRDNGGHAVALAWSMEAVYDIAPGETWWAASDVGWVVGHSFGVYGPLLHRATSVIYEGKPVGTPDAGKFWQVAAAHRVAGMFAAPTALRAIKRLDPDGYLPRQHDLSALRTLFLAGERAGESTVCCYCVGLCLCPQTNARSVHVLPCVDPATIRWAEGALKIPVLDHWWQTESGWPIAANQVGTQGYLPVKYGSSFKPVQGWDLRVFSAEVEGDCSGGAPVELAAGSMGRIAVKLPTPPGFMMTLYQRDDSFLSSYMQDIPGYYSTGDTGVIDSDGYVHILTRTDDVINVAGHRLSTGAMEEIVADHPSVAEVAVVGVKDDLRGQVPMALFVKLSNAGEGPSDAEIIAELVSMVRSRIGAVACFKDAIPVARLPKTRSGKILRVTIRGIADGDSDVRVPATIEDPVVLDEIREALRDYKR
jgi:propionyl-CoA synthetase